jgi:hypothetical protein
LKQAFERIGLISRLKSSDSEASAPPIPIANSAANRTITLLAGVTQRVRATDTGDSEIPLGPRKSHRERLHREVPFFVGGPGG